MRLVKLVAREGFDVWINRDQVACVHAEGKMIGETVVRLSGGTAAIIVKGTTQDVVNELKGAE
jgi:hypothetical protein